MKFRYPKDKELEMAGRLYYFEHTHFYNVSPMHRELINDSNKFPAWIKAHACDAFVTEDGQGICCLTPNPDGSKMVYAIWVNPAFRGHGYGAEMLEYAKTLSPKGLTLHVNVQNPKALCLYHKCGFNVGTLEGKEDVIGFYWRVYMETKPGLKGHEAETMEYEYPPKKVVYDV
jgi:ribosomal protein S18 acetylase RimI-like enzyme